MLATLMYAATEATPLLSQLMIVESRRKHPRTLASLRWRTSKPTVERPASISQMPGGTSVAFPLSAQVVTFQWFGKPRRRPHRRYPQEDCGFLLKGGPWPPTLPASRGSPLWAVSLDRPGPFEGLEEDRLRTEDELDLVSRDPGLVVAQLRSRIASISCLVTSSGQLHREDSRCLGVPLLRSACCAAFADRRASPP